MEYRPLGETEIDLSEIGFGCGDNGGIMMSGTAEERSAAVARALELGINYFDTAAHYGDTLSETNLGQAFRDLKARPIIATKVQLLESDMADIPGAITRSVEGSLSRLQVGGVDMLYLHNRIGPERVIAANGGVQRVSVDDVMGPGGVLEAFQGLQTQGKTVFLGVCTTGGDSAALRRVLSGRQFDCLQAQYNILNPTEAREAPQGFAGTDYGNSIDYAVSLGMGVVTYRTLASGALSGRATGRETAYRSSSEWADNLARANALAFLVDDYVDSLAEAAVRFALTKEEVTCALLGFSRQAYMRQAVDWTSRGPLPDEAIERIEALYRTDFSRT
jgi:aryl-alcohol dehydrogenase-like predicted oxidoreductase